MKLKFVVDFDGPVVYFDGPLTEADTALITDLFRLLKKHGYTKVEIPYSLTVEAKEQ